MHISTYKQHPLSFDPIHQQHAVFFSQIFTYEPNNQHYGIVILLHYDIAEFGNVSVNNMQSLSASQKIIPIFKF